MGAVRGFRGASEEQEEEQRPDPVDVGVKAEPGKLFPAQLQRGKAAGVGEPVTGTVRVFTDR